MNGFILFLGLVIVATLIGCEFYLLISHWRTITNTANSGTIGPLITSIFTPAVAVVTVLFLVPANHRSVQAQPGA